MMTPTPLRPDEQVAGGFIGMSLGGQSFVVKVLPMSLSRKWLVDAKAAIGRLKGSAEHLDSFEDVADFIAGQSEAMMDLLIAYDALGDKALPEREWIDTNATDGEVYDGWKRVTAATSPLAQEALRIVPDLVPILVEAFREAVTTGTAGAMVAIHSPRHTSGSPPSTDGAPTSSKATSPTSSSPSSPSKPRGVRKPKPSPH